MYAAGNVVGTNIFFERDAPRNYLVLAVFLVFYAGMIVLAVVMRVSMRVENRRRDRDSLSLPGDRQAILDGLKDMTDMESKHFRYAL